MHFLPTDNVPGFPADNPRARLIEGPHGHHTVVELIPTGGPAPRRVVIGKIVDGRYYSIDEYHAAFSRGQPRMVQPPAERGARRYQRTKPYVKPVRKLKEGLTPLPLPEEIENFPYDNPKAAVIRSGKYFYVAERTSYRMPAADGKPAQNKVIKRYLGRVHQGRFYTTEEFKRLFKRDGTPREQN